MAHDDDHEHVHDPEEEIVDGVEHAEGGIPDFYRVDHVELTTVGIDIGTSTSHLMFSRLYLERLAQSLSSRYVVARREVLARSPILLTPYMADSSIDAAELGAFIERSYRDAGIAPADVDSGAVILTGEALRRTNARAIADLFADQAGKFVCASAGANLEAVMAAHGSGAVALSRSLGATVLNVDVGGGTSKLSLIRGGDVVATMAINVGGRLVAMDEEERVNRIEPAARQVAESLGITLRLHDRLSREDQKNLAETLADCLFQAIRRESPSPLARGLLITPALASPEEIDCVVFSGGVSEYVYEREQRHFGDIALLLGDAIRARIANHQLPAPLRESGERIRATVIGASQFTVQVSGNTIFVSHPEMLPIHNIPVLYLRLPDKENVDMEEVSAAIRRSLDRLDLEEGEQSVAVAIGWEGLPAYPQLRSLANGILQGLPRTVASDLPLVLVFRNDYGKLVGQLLRDDLGIHNNVISVDAVELNEFDYIDVGEMVHPAQVVPVVIKSLVFPDPDGIRPEIADGRTPGEAAGADARATQRSG